MEVIVKPFGIIYKTINLITNKCYIGKTNNGLNNRMKGHKHYALKIHNNDYFHKSIKKYGWNNFEWKILCECTTPEILNIMETFYIIVHKTHVSEGGYNLTWGGDGSLGFKHSEETKQKISENMKIISNSIEHKERTRLLGKRSTKHSDETKKKISEIVKSRPPISEETRRKMSESNKGEKNAFFGKKHSEETKNKIRKTILERQGM